METLPLVELSAEEIALIRHGRTISKPTPPSDVKEFAAVNLSGRLVSILTQRGPRLLGPLRNLPPEA